MLVRNAQTAMNAGQGDLGAVYQGATASSGPGCSCATWPIACMPNCQPVGDDARGRSGRSTGNVPAAGQKGQCVNQPSRLPRFAARFRLVTDPDSEAPALDESRDLGWMLYGHGFCGGQRPKPRFFRADLQNGVIDLAQAQVTA